MGEVSFRVASLQGVFERYLVGLPCLQQRVIARVCFAAGLLRVALGDKLESARYRLRLAG